MLHINSYMREKVKTGNQSGGCCENPEGSGLDQSDSSGEKEKKSGN